MKDADTGVDVEMESSPTAEGAFTLSHVKVFTLYLIHPQCTFQVERRRQTTLQRKFRLMGPEGRAENGGGSRRV